MLNSRQLQSLPVVSVCTHVLSNPPCFSVFPSSTNISIRLEVTQPVLARVWVLMTHSTQYCWFSTATHLSHTHYKHQEKGQQFWGGCLHWFPQVKYVIAVSYCLDLQSSKFRVPKTFSHLPFVFQILLPKSNSCYRRPTSVIAQSLWPVYISPSGQELKQ